MSRASRLLSNISYNFLSQFWFLILGLVTTPYIVRKLGADAYGVLSIVSVVMGYFAVLDLGLGAATIKYIADYYSRRDFVSLSKVVGTSLVIYSGLGVFGAALIAGAAGFITTKVVHVPQNLVEVTQLVFYISSFGFLVNMPLTVFNSIPNALQRFDILVKRNLVLGTTNVIGQVVLLSIGFSLKEIATLNVGVSIIAILVFVVVSRRLLPEASFRPSVDARILAQLFKFGIMKFLNQIASQSVFHLDKVLIAMFLPVSWVTYYVVPLGLAQKLMAVQGNIATAYFPAACELVGQGDRERLTNLYISSMKLVALIALPLSLTLYFFAFPILSLWMKGDFAEKSTLTLKVLAIAYFFASLSTVPALSADASGRPQVTTFFSILSALINLTCALLFIPRLGILGAAVAIAVNAVVQVPIFIHYVNRKILLITTSSVMRKCFLKPFIAGLASSILLSLFNLGTPKAGVLLPAFGLSMTMFVAVALLIKVFDPKEMEAVRGYELALLKKLKRAAFLEADR